MNEREILLAILEEIKCLREALTKPMYIPEIRDWVCSDPSTGPIPKWEVTS